MDELNQRIDAPAEAMSASPDRQLFERCVARNTRVTASGACHCLTVFGKQCLFEPLRKCEDTASPQTPKQWQRFSTCCQILFVLVAVVIVNNGLGFAAEDDYSEAARPLAEQRILVEEANFEQWVYGTNNSDHQQRIDNRIEQKLREIARNYEISPAERQKLVLATRADKARFEREVDELRRRFQAARTNLIELRTISVEAQKLRTKHMKQSDIFGDDSYFGKISRRVLAGKLPVTRPLPGMAVAANYNGNDPDLHLRRHRANIEAAIRAVERRVVPGNSQREELAKLLLAEIPPAMVFGDFDDIVVKYRFSQLPAEKLKPLFNEAQWPRVLVVLEGFQEFGPVLARHELPGDDAIVAQQPVQPGRVQNPPVYQPLLVDEKFKAAPKIRSKD